MRVIPPRHVRTAAVGAVAVVALTACSAAPPTTDVLVEVREGVPAADVAWELRVAPDMEYVDGGFAATLTDEQLARARQHPDVVDVRDDDRTPWPSPTIR